MVFKVPSNPACSVLPSSSPAFTPLVASFQLLFLPALQQQQLRPRACRVHLPRQTRRGASDASFSGVLQWEPASCATRGLQEELQRVPGRVLAPPAEI